MGKNPAAPAVKREAEEDWAKMTHRKREIIGLRNEQDFPHLVEVALPSGGFRSVSLDIDVFHRERRIPVRRGRSRHEGEQFNTRFCFPDIATADAFRNRFGGECLTYAPNNPKAYAEEAWGPVTYLLAKVARACHLNHTPD